jgi:uncharacterized protein YbjT (DUF2867 family)
MSIDGKLIAITGVTGSQGGATARRLLSDGWRLRGLTRNAGSAGARAMAAAGVELVQGDMGDRAALDRLFAGAHGVYGVTDFFRNGLVREVEHGRLIAEAARDAGVAHVVFPSVGLADRNSGVPYLEAKCAIEKHLERTGVPLTVIRPTLFLEDLVELKYAAPVWWGTVRRLVGPDKRLLWIAVADVGAIAARMFASPETFIGQKLTLAGDFRSFTEAKQIFRKVRGRAPLALPLPVWLTRRLVNADLVPMWEWLGRNPIEGDVESIRRIHPELMDMETWLRRRDGAR